MRRIGLLAVSTFLIAIPSAAAPARSIAVVYAAPPECPSESTFVSRLRERTDVTVAPHESADLTLETTIEKRLDSFFGRMVVRDRIGAETSRDLSTSTCADIVEALALTAALSLGGEARAPEPRSNVVAVSPAPPEDTAAVPVPLAATDRNWSAIARVETAATYGYFPETMPAVGGSIGMAWGGRESAAPFVALGFRTLLPKDRPLPVGAASFRWELGRISACPIAWEAAPRVSIAPCAHVDVGRIAAESRGGDASLSKSALWAGASLGGFAAFRPSRWLSGGLAANVVVPLIRPTFGYGAERDVVRAGAIGAEVGIFAALHL